MLYIGINVAKVNYFAAALLTYDQVIIEPFKFMNDVSGFQLISDKINYLSADNLIFGLESTAHYGNKIAEDQSYYNVLGHCAGKFVRII